MIRHEDSDRHEPSAGVGRQVGHVLIPRIPVRCNAKGQIDLKGDAENKLFGVILFRLPALYHDAPL
jgi:hypothetical protein